MIGMMAKLDRGTRIYMVILSLVVLGLLFMALYEAPEVRHLNGLLEADSELESFPYRFRVIAVRNGIATMHTPRSADVPVVRVIGILYPHLAGRSADSPDFRKAQLELARIQKRAKQIVISDPTIKTVHWTLDRDWLSGHGVILTD
jgi:hypothetical protein